MNKPSLVELFAHNHRLKETNKELVDALQNLMNGIERGAITSDHDETFANATKQASIALKKAKGV